MRGNMRDQKGSVLLLALMIMSSVVIASVGMSSLILASLQQSRVLDNAAIAYYAAESGIEDALFSARRDEELPTVESGIALSNDAAWDRTVEDKEWIIYPGTIVQDAVTEIALYDPDAPTDDTGIANVRVEWSDDCGGFSVLQATLVGWQSGGAIAWDANASTRLFTLDAGGGADVTMPVSGRLYRLRLAAKKCALQNVSVDATNASGGAVQIPGRIKVDSTGTYSNARQTITATLPRRAPLSGLFDFVIFSECSLVKGGTGSCP